MMEFHWPQITLLILMALGVGLASAKHGEPQPRYNAGVTIISTIILGVLLWFGGFWG